MEFSLNVIDWTAIGALSTTIGIIIALALPFCSQKKKNNRYKRMIENELGLNLEILNGALNCGGSNSNFEIIIQLKFESWDSFT